jgi:phosphoglycerol transferase
MLINIKKNNILVDVYLCFAVILIVVFTTIYFYDFYKREVFKEPANYYWDGIYGLAVVKIASEDGIPFFKAKEITNLGAPYLADWNAWPIGREGIWRLGGLIAKFYGLGETANIMLIIAHASAALAMFLSLKILGCDRIWCSALSICFGLAPYLFYRSWYHIPLTFAYPIPIYCAIIYYILKNGGKLFSKYQVAGLIFVSVLLGGFIYYQFIYFCMLVFAAISILVCFRAKKNFFLILLSSALLPVVYIVQSWPVFYDTILNGKNFDAVRRYYAEIQICSLRPLEMFLPSLGSGIPFLSNFSEFYRNQDIFQQKGIDVGFLSSYLGLPGIICLVFLLAHTCFFLFSRQQEKISGWFWLVMATLSFSVLGGINGMLGLLKIYYFRDSSRFSILILAAVFFFVAILFSKKQVNKYRIISATVACCLVFLAVLEVALRKPKSYINTLDKISLSNDLEFFSRIESALPPGAMVYNYPTDRFPEGVLRYSHLRGFIASKNIKFSHGSVAGRAREGWQDLFTGMPSDKIVAQLAKVGFSGILVYTGPFLNSDSELKNKTTKMVDDLRNLNLTELQSGCKTFSFFKILPNQSALYPESPPYFSRGFWKPEIQNPESTEVVNVKSRIRWAAQNKAIIEIYNEQPITRCLILRGGILSTTESDLQIKVNNLLVFTEKLSTQSPAGFSTIPIYVSGHKPVRFLFHSAKEPIFIDGRKFSFALVDLKAEWDKLDTIK